MTAGVQQPGTSVEAPPRSHLAGLDGYRAIAALMVLLTHVAFATGEIGRSGIGQVMARLDFGVTLFFLLSGFLLYRPWARAALTSGRPPRLGPYALRRAARILPLYWVVVVTVLLVLPEIRPVSPQTWTVHLLALHIYIPGFAVEGLTQTWSLATEIAFYALLPLIALLARGRAARSVDAAFRRQLVVLGVFAACGVAFVAAKGFLGMVDLAGYWLPFYADWFALGMALAVIDARSSLPDPPRLVGLVRTLAAEHVTLFVLAVALFAVAVTPLGGSYVFYLPTGPWENLARHLLYAAVGLALMLPAVMAPTGPVAGFLSQPWLRRLGLISYGIFLWHVLVLRLVMPALGIELFGGSTLLVAVATTVVTIAVATVTYWAVERPFQRWAHRA